MNVRPFKLLLAVTAGFAPMLIPATADAVVAGRVGADFRTVSPTANQTTASFGGGLGILDTAGLGYWNYFESSNVNPSLGTLQLLTWGVVGNGGNSGFGGDAQSGGFHVPAIAAGKLFGDGAVPAADQIAWHPGDGVASTGNKIFTVLRWTAGAAEAGPISLSGIVSKVGEPPSGVVDFHIFVNGSEVFTQASMNAATGDVPFNLNNTIASGQHVDFVLGNFNGQYGADETKLSATINAVPEPSAMLFAAIGAGVLGMRRKRGGG